MHPVAGAGDDVDIGAHRAGIFARCWWHWSRSSTATTSTCASANPAACSSSGRDGSPKNPFTPKRRMVSIVVMSLSSTTVEMPEVRTSRLTT
jgi:hypothetical protein